MYNSGWSKYVKECSSLITSAPHFVSLLNKYHCFVKQALKLECAEGYKLFIERKIKYLYNYGGFLIVKFI